MATNSCASAAARWRHPRVGGAGGVPEDFTLAEAHRLHRAGRSGDHCARDAQGLGAVVRRAQRIPRHVAEQDMTRAVNAERDGFAALLGRFSRALARDLARGAVTSDFVVDLERRIKTMTEQVGLGLHIVGTRPRDDPDPASVDAPRLRGGGA